ncbi:proline dehydrogenase family protein [Patescibacteria group bacterium]|nr:proline dehydrogenase family protein [Patescibacteria group bacterium]
MEYGFLRLFLRTPFARPFVKRFVAGETIEKGMAVAEKLKKEGYKITLSYLGGEHLTDPKEIRNAFCAHSNLLTEMTRGGLHHDIAIKLSQFGLFSEIHRQWEIVFFQRLKNFVRRAELNNVFVWVDAEELKFREKTFEIISHLHYDNLGVCVQAYAKDSLDFLQKNLRPNLAVRICKGAYKENEEGVFTNKKEIRYCFLDLVGHCVGEGVPRIQAATQDKYLIRYLTERIKGFKNVEVAVLLGRDKIFADLVYVPFGPKWEDFIVRRIQEKPSYLFLPFKN